MSARAPVVVPSARTISDDSSEPADAGLLSPLRGFVVDKDTREPLAHFTLSLQVAGGMAMRVITDHKGRLETESVLPSGVMHVGHVPDPTRFLYSVPCRVYPDAIPLPTSAIPGRLVDDRVLFTAALPRQAFWIEALKPDGRPAERALVRCMWELPERKGYRDTGQLVANGQGLVAVRWRDGWKESVGERPFLACAELAEEALAGRIDQYAPIRLPNGPLLIRILLGPAAFVRVRVVDPDDRPLAGVWTGVAWKSHPSASLSQGQFTDAGGEARLGPVPPGTLLVHAGVPGWARQPSSAGQLIEVAPGGESPVRLRLGARCAEDQQRRWIAGVVLDPAGRPVLGVSLTASRAGDASTPRSSTVETDAIGRFRFETLDEDTRWMIRPTPSAGRDLIEPAEVEADLGEDQLVFRRIRVLPAHRVSVRVTDLQTEEPIEDAEIRVTHVGSSWAFVDRTGELGISTFDLKVNRSALISARAVGYMPSETPVKEGAVPYDLHLRLRRGLRMQVRVLDGESYRPLAGAEIWIGSRRVASTDVSGRAEVSSEHVPRRIVIRAAGYEPSVESPGDEDEDEVIVHLSALR